MHVVTVTFQVKLGRSDNFREVILANAASSLENEAGCHMFDVCEKEGGEFFHEVYEDVTALDFHRSTGHFAKFDAASASWIDNKKIARYELVKNRVGQKRP